MGNGLIPRYDGIENVAAYREPKLKEKLDLAVAHAEKRLEDAKRARAILDKNPDIEELIDILGRQGNF